MIDFDKFISVLGVAEDSKEFSEFVLSLSEKFIISEDLDEYNDSIGKTKHYECFELGFSIGFRQKILNHIHFFFEEYESYSICKKIDFLNLSINATSTEQEIVKQLGSPVFSGGGYPDAFFGYINRWIKYEENAYFLHFELNASNKIAKVSLIAKE
jgi:hypothetical protein